MVVPPVQRQQPASTELGRAPELGGTSEPGGASELRETPEPGGLDDFDSGPPTPLPLLGRGIHHQRRASTISVERHPRRRVWDMVAKVRGVL